MKTLVKIAQVFIVFVILVGSLLGAYVSASTATEIEFDIWFDESLNEYVIKSVVLDGVLPLNGTKIQILIGDEIVSTAEFGPLFYPNIPAKGGFSGIKVVLLDGTVYKCIIYDTANFPIRSSDKKLLKLAEINCFIK